MKTNCQRGGRHSHEPDPPQPVRRISTQKRVRKFAEAQSLLNVSRRSVQRAVKVKEDGAPELVAAVNAGRLSVSLAAGDFFRVRLPAPI
jgi:hypothetical protein